MKKPVKTLLIALAIVLAAGAAIGGYFIWRNSQYIGKDGALNAALADMGLERSDVYEVDIDLEDRMGGKYYEVEIEARDVGGGHIEAEYHIDAVTGEILLADRG